jgi:RNA polymerase sigma-70 factor (ECF subfamily)
MSGGPSSFWAPRASMSVMGDDDDDSALVHRALNDDADAFARLYRRYVRPVWNLSFYMCGRNHHEAEEATQETFLKAWRGLGGFRERSTFKSWLLSICRNVCLDRMRKSNKATLQLGEFLDAAAQDEVAPQGDRRDDLDRIALRWALGELSKDECEAWFLMDVLGCTSSEAAELVGVRAATTMRSRLDRARRQIAGALRGDPSGAEHGEAEICGLYRSAVERAIVAALVSPAAVAAAPASVACFDGRPPPTPAPSACESTVDFDLVGFFDRLERELPTATRIVGVVNGQGTAEAERWLACRPRWQLLRASTQSWRAEAERLLAHCSATRSAFETGQVLALLDAAEPFVWTCGHDGALL